MEYVSDTHTKHDWEGVGWTNAAASTVHSLAALCRFASARENTIFSLNNAAQRGADFVEFDVQLSRDQTVVIFHDFHVLVSVAKRSSQLLDPDRTATPTRAIPKSNSEADVCEQAERVERQKGEDMHQIALRELSLAQLRLLQVNRK